MIKNATGVIAAIVFGLLAGSAPAQDSAFFGGPTELQDTFLPAQLRYQTYPESAFVIPAGTWSVRVEEDWTAHLAQTESYLIDGESLTSTLKIRHSFAPNWEVGVDLPYTSRFDGAADEFIEFVETTLDAKVPARYELPRDTYNATISTDGGRPLNFLEKNGLGDLTIRLKRQITTSKAMFLDSAVTLGLSLPSGEKTFGGNGVAPYVGIHMQKPIARRLSLYLGGSGIYYSDADENGFLLAELRGMGYAGAALKLADWFQFMVMYQIYSPLARSNPPLDDPSHYYSIMGRFRLGERFDFEAGVVENLGVIENRNSSDVTFKFALGMKF